MFRGKKSITDGNKFEKNIPFHNDEIEEDKEYEKIHNEFAKNIKKRRNRFRDSFGVCGYSRIVPRFCKHSESAGATSSCLAGSKFERFIVQARTAFEL